MSSLRISEHPTTPSSRNSGYNRRRKRDATASENKKSTGTRMTDRSTSKRDDSIMDTNNSSIVSKRSVEKLYYAGEPEYFRPFVAKFKRRSPLINRGYWLRMKAIEYGVMRFLLEPTTKRKLVVNLGCGYDPLPFMFLGQHPHVVKGAVFVDVDYPQLMRHKVDTIANTQQLLQLLPSFTISEDSTSVLATSNPYLAIGCDLNDISSTKVVLDGELGLSDPDVALLFVGEVSLTYMSKDASQSVLQWAATHDDVRFCLLEQHLPDGPDHPFAETMLSHFRKLNTPLNAIGTMEDMRLRFVEAGWPEPGLDIRTLWEWWSNPEFLTVEQRRRLDQVEPFDEWEEFALFGSHYFLMLAEKRPDSGRPIDKGPSSLNPEFVGSGAGETNTEQSQTAHSELQSKTSVLYAPRISGSYVPRRFGALVPPLSSSFDGSTIGLLAGIGGQERRVDCDTFSRAGDPLLIHGPPLRTGISCFTVTHIGTTSDCLMTGGRTSPDKALAHTWIRQNGHWKREQDLPEARFRHCAVSVKHPRRSNSGQTVLIFGGKTSAGEVLDEWMLWIGDAWQRINVIGDGPSARFGAAMITDSQDQSSGLLAGGMTNDGRVVSDLWRWTVEEDLTVHCRNITSHAIGGLKPNSRIFGRFGAQLVRSNSSILLIGGIAEDNLLTRRDEVVNMETFQTLPIMGDRPLLIGCSVAAIDGDLVVLGGGATCFSFGTYWNQPSILTEDPSAPLVSDFRLIATQHSDSQKQTAQSLTDRGVSTKTPSTSAAQVPFKNESSCDFRQNTRQISRVTNSDIDFTRILNQGIPIIITNCEIGPCVRVWDEEYLKERIGSDRKVVVHSSQLDQMDFQNKNFEYLTLQFAEFLNRIRQGDRLYLRALSRDSPSDRPTNLADDFPEISADFELPEELNYVVQNLHSSPLRISGPVNMWLHYDVMANVLCQVRGRKKLLLYPPSDVGQLGFGPGSSSSSLNVFSPSATTNSMLAHTHPHEAILEPGDILFIPPMWIHTAAPTDGVSIAVNAFFRSFESHAYAAGRDVYGNRDLASYERGRKDIARIIKSFDDIPSDVAGFYLQRLGDELLDRAKALSRNADL